MKLPTPSDPWGDKCLFQNESMQVFVSIKWAPQGLGAEGEDGCGILKN